MMWSKIGGVLLPVIVAGLIWLIPQRSAAEPLVYASADAVRPLLVGTEVPGGELKTGTGASFDLSAAMQAKPTVLVFYRGNW